MTELPLKPLAPIKPAAFSGIDVLSTDVAYYAGFGMPTSGLLSSNTLKYGDKKVFGYIGQGSTKETIPSMVAALDGATTALCKTRYLAINVMPYTNLADPSATDDKVVLELSKNASLDTLDVAEAD